MFVGQILIKLKLFRKMYIRKLANSLQLKFINDFNYFLGYLILKKPVNSNIFKQVKQVSVLKIAIRGETQSRVVHQQLH